MDYAKRVDSLRRKFEKEKIDAFLVTKTENVFYLTSFYSDSVVLVMGRKKNFAITDFRYAEAASGKIKNFELIVLNNKLNSFPEAIAAALDKMRAKRVGFEPSAITFSKYRNIKLAVKNRTLISSADMVEAIREVKAPNEIASIKRALAITKKALKGVKGILKPALTELEVAKYVKMALIKNGAEGPAFEPIVATQPGASQPHYRAKAKRLGNNKPILIDLGAKYEGYNSDLTRMLPLGKINTKFNGLYRILIDAQNRAIDLIRPGAQISDIDNAARQYIAGKGFGRFFGHSLGHGIGLEIHERPAITHKNEDILREGMVFTVEPGIYIPGCGGLRIEDIIQVTREGCKVLTDDIDK